MAEKALKRNKDIYSLGSIIHNEQVVKDLARKGLKVIKDIKGIKSGTVVISSHGISPKVAGDIAKRGIKIIDTTCPFVLNAQRIAKKISDEGYVTVIVGDANHPEVKALVDFVSGGSKVFVVKDKSQAKALKFRPGEKISVISQTTQSPDNFIDVVRAILDKRPKEARIFNTICRDAEERQALAKALAKEAGLMLIIGGRHSANTRRLFEVCRKISKKSYLIETERELNKSWLKTKQTVGITSGASTPDWVVKKVVDEINK